MANRVDLIGYRFPDTRLVVRGIDPAPHPVAKNGRVYNARYWLCDCDCGAANVSVKPSSLYNGNTKSCGCLQREKVRAIGRKYGGRRVGWGLCLFCGQAYERTATQKYCSVECRRGVDRRRRFAPAELQFNLLQLRLGEANEDDNGDRDSRPPVA